MIVPATPWRRIGDATPIIVLASIGGMCAFVAWPAEYVAGSLWAFAVTIAVGVAFDVAAMVLLNRLIRRRCAEARADEFTKSVLGRVDGHSL